MGDERLETATLAAGCFWCVEAIFDDLRGVEDVVSCYSGGHKDNPTYQEVCSETTGHAEVVQIRFCPAEITFADILRVFFTVHDPTTLNRQGNDIGSSYRSAIFYHNDTQRKIAEQVIANVNASGKWKRPVVTELVEAGPWSKAEDYHQDYLQKHPDGYTCHFLRD